MTTTDKAATSLNDVWAIRKDRALTFAGIAMPIVLAGLGGWFNLITKESENRVRYVELAISQLSTSPTPATAALRDWSIELLDSQSPTKLPPTAKEQLKTYSLPMALAGTAHGVTMASGAATISVGKATTPETALKE